MPKPNAVRLNTDNLPWGTASVNKRRNMYWAVWTDEQGTRHQISTQTGDREEARRFAAERAIEVLKAKLTALQEVVNEAAEGHGKAGRGTDRQAAGRRAEAAGRDRQAASKGKGRR
jgi:hypothetical protein